LQARGAAAAAAAARASGGGGGGSKGRKRAAAAAGEMQAKGLPGKAAQLSRRSRPLMGCNPGVLLAVVLLLLMPHESTRTAL
jgi:hypothetical protein